ncbi:MAG: hypothetical protein AAGF93_09210 [Cyanobacteria bacterium P01_H01_bin.105]
MDRKSLLTFVRYAFYTVLVCGLLYVLIPMEPPSLQPLVVKIVIQQLTILCIVALFLERALEVYKLSFFSLEKEQLAAQVEHFQRERQFLVNNADSSSDSESLEAIQLRLLNAEESFRVYINQMRQRLLQVAIVFGGLIGLVGVRSLESAFVFPVPESVLEIFRFYLFRVLDVILTACLIAGGSEGIHNVIKKLSSFVPDLSEKVIEFVQAMKQNSV